MRATGTDPATTPASWEPRPTEEATRLILVRHGETERTVQKRYSGRGDVPLTARGRAQARATAARVAALAPSVAAVVSSPLSRCTATAEAVAAQAGNPPVRTDDDLIECDFGVWEGTRSPRYARAGRPNWTPGSPRPVAPPRGESFVTVAERTGRAVDRLRSAYPGRRSWWSPTSRRSSWCCATRSPPATRSCTGSTWTRRVSRCWTCTGRRRRGPLGERHLAPHGRLTAARRMPAAVRRIDITRSDVTPVTGS
ncbi:histidine phosphatase family protein [Micromonospora sp. BRA006-A]|nr:histidine phosphatase family protein [Micromonospora sp. BRA006-A]